MTFLASKRLWLAVLAWSITLVVFFPIFWMFLTGFKTEAAAVSKPYVKVVKAVCWIPPLRALLCQ